MTELTILQAVRDVAEANHCQAGAAIAASAAMAAALAQATANVTLMLGATGDTETTSRQVQTTMTATRARLLAIADEDAKAIGEMVRLREAGQPLQGYQVLCDGPQEMAQLGIAAAQAMQAFRPFVCERTRDDLEFALTLMHGAALAAMQLLDSNLRIWPLPELIATYDPAVRQLSADLALLMPMKRIRNL
jgi:hypothetical protein